MNSLRKSVLEIIRLKTFKLPRAMGVQFYSSAQPMVKEPHPPSVRKIQDLFNVKKSVASSLLRSHEKFNKVTVNEIDKAFNLCLTKGIKKEHLVNHIEVLTVSDIEEKINLLRELPYDLNSTFPLLLLNNKQLLKFVNQEKTEKRIIFFSKQFKISELQVCLLLCSRSFLLTIDLEHVQKSLELLIKYDISCEEILKDVWVLRYSLENVESRLKFASENHVEKIKTWMVRVPPVIFENCIRRKSDNKTILGQNSFVEYLAERLQCSHELVKYIIFKHPAIESKSLKRMNEIIDFLLSQGFKTIHICRTPKILLHSVDTIRERLRLIHDKGGHLNGLSPLTKSQKQFMQFLESLILEKKKSNKS